MSKWRILVIDDHADTRVVLEKLLSRMGHRVTAAGSCAEARAAAETNGWDFNMLLCDVGLPDGDGAELMSEFKSRCECIAIALTGRNAQSDLDRYSALLVDRCLVKPVQFNDLRDTIDRAVTPG